ncbi:MAG: DUF4321 domain-containing protein [Chitinispirillia bacterium]|nr:DUF4321 domain-containing protein [Chitinispirillia bacterium]MCL2241754.1 DUF4321 domain-containing protein [Chitinispirillia bacterium]
MAVQRKDKKVGTLILVVLLGIIIGAYLNALVLMIPGDNVFKTFFTYTIPFGLNGIDIDLYAIKFQFGLQFRFSLMSIIGVFLSLYFFRWYK